MLPRSARGQKEGRMSATNQPDFEQRLPEGREWFGVRWIARHLSVWINHVNDLIDWGVINNAVAPISGNQ